MVRKKSCAQKRGCLQLSIIERDIDATTEVEMEVPRSTGDCVRKTVETGCDLNAPTTKVQVEEPKLRRGKKDTPLDVEVDRKTKKKEIRVRSDCNTSWVAKANIHLTELQKTKINGTPFRHMINFPSKLKISGELLKELAWRWDERCGGFRVGTGICHFSPMDCCLSLGLPIVGDELLVQQGKSSIFSNLGYDIEGIYDKLSTLRADSDVDEFCKCYIALGMAEFYFTGSNRESQEQTNHWFKLLDDLDLLANYNWGIAVYNYLVSSLTEVCRKVRDGKVAAQTNIKGCAFLLQVWALEHIFWEPASSIGNRYPRAEKWFDFHLNSKMGDVSTAFRNNVYCKDIIPTPTELEDRVVMEAAENAPAGYVLWKKGALVMKTLIAENEAMRLAKESIEERANKLEQQLRELKNSSDSPYEQRDIQDQEHEPQRMSPAGVPFEVTDPVGVDEEDPDKSPSMYDRMKKNPRPRMKSSSMKTPYIVGQKRKTGK